MNIHGRVRFKRAWVRVRDRESGSVVGVSGVVGKKLHLMAGKLVDLMEASMVENLAGHSAVCSVARRVAMWAASTAVVRRPHRWLRTWLIARL